MVCIAAFIILVLIGVFVAIISIFKPKVGKAYFKMFKKAWGCLWKKVRLQKCETGFKEDIKNTILSRVIVRHPKLVKPLSAVIEIMSVVIVIVAVWALLTAIKSLLALWALGSCNVTRPSACTLGTEVCSIDEDEPKNPIEGTVRWFTEWGEIFEAIADKSQTYDAASYDFDYITINPDAPSDAQIVLDIVDPGCFVCLQSYLNQKKSGFFDTHNVRLVPFPIQDADGSFKFKNSELIVRYMFALEQLHSGMAMRVLDRIFTDKDEVGSSYQTLFNTFSEEKAHEMLRGWLKEFGLDDAALDELEAIASYPEISDKIANNQDLTSKLRIRGIPTVIYDGKKHTGLWKDSD